VLREQRREVDVEQLVAVQGEDVTVLAALCRGEADSSAPPQPFRLFRDCELRSDPVQRREELRSRAGVAAEDHPFDPCAGEQADLPRDERTAPDRHERLW
jgi:hypothetical protein